MGLRKGDEVISADVIGVNEGDLLVVTENGYGKRTKLADYPRKGRGGLGVKTAQLVEGKGRLVGARVVREGYQVMLISTGGTVIKMPVDDIKRSGRSTQGVIVMRFKTDDERVSALAPVVESDEVEAVAEESASEVVSVAPEE
jgi:DNA gyrase subunit A